MPKRRNKCKYPEHRMNLRCWRAHHCDCRCGTARIGMGCDMRPREGVWIFLHLHWKPSGDLNIHLSQFALVFVVVVVVIEANEQLVRVQLDGFLSTRTTV